MNANFVAAVNGLILSIPLTAAVWLVLRIAGGALNAATRYGVWFVTLIVTTLLPLFYLPRSPQPLPAPARTAAPALPRPSVSSEQQASMVWRAPLYSDSAPARRAVTLIAFPRSRWPQWLARLWAVSALLMLARLTLSVAMLQRQRRRAGPPPAEVAASMQRCLKRCGVKRRARIAVIEKGASPMVAGPFDLSILIPARLLTALNETELEQICLHEAAHLARFDDCTLLLERVFEAVFVFHPAVRWIARRIDLEREIACDDRVIDATGQPRSYASCLTHVAELAGGYPTTPAAPAAAEESSHLNKRIDLLLNDRRRAGARLLRTRFIAALAVLGLLTWLAGRSPALLALAAAPLQPVLPKAHAPAAVQSLPVRFAQPAAVRQPSPATQFVHLFVSVTDPAHRFVTGLDKTAFRVYEDGVEQQVTSVTGEDTNGSLIVVSNRDANLHALERTIAATEQKLRDLRAVYKDSHPDVVALRQQLQQLATERNAGSDSPMAMLAATTASLEGQVTRLEQELNVLAAQKSNDEARIVQLEHQLGTIDLLSANGLANAALRANIQGQIAKDKTLLANEERDAAFRQKELQRLNTEIGAVRARMKSGVRVPENFVGSAEGSLFDRLSSAIDTASHSPDARRAIVIVFDAGDDSISWPENELHSLIQRSALPIYTIAVHRPGELENAEAAGIMNLLSTATGGSELNAASWADVPELEKKVEVELRNQYAVTYVSNSANRGDGYRRIEVRIVPSPGLPELRAHARPGYYTRSR